MSKPYIDPDEVFEGRGVALRLCSLSDCTERYVSWLNDPEVNLYLETRYETQTREMVETYVKTVQATPNNYMFAIIDKQDDQHVGNLKIGAMNFRHSYAEVSYFIGDRTRWGRGLATAAIDLSVRIARERLKFFRLEAGFYESNVGSRRALEKVGFQQEAVFRQRLLQGDRREDHVYYGLIL